MTRKPRPSSKRQTTQYNHFQNVKNALSNIYSQAIAFRLTHDTILDKLAGLPFEQLQALDRLSSRLRARFERWLYG